jgi:hypothetical protein
MHRTSILWVVATAWLMAFPAFGFGAAPDDEVKERLRTDPFMMPYYTGRIFPTPQSAAYRDQYLPLNRTAIVVGKEVENAPVLAKLLTDRISRYGGSAEVVASPSPPHETIISLGETATAARVSGLPKVPEPEQAYLIHPATLDGKNVVILKGRDRLGLVWAIGSFNQLVHRQEGKTVARAAEVSDFPAIPNRGYLHGNVDCLGGSFGIAHSVLYNVTFKFNMPIYKHLCMHYKAADDAWKHPEKWPETNQAQIRQLKEQMTPLGIDWIGGLHPIKGPRATMLSGSDDDINCLLHYARAVAAAGGRFYLQFDDYRFPINPKDLERFGSARETDLHILNTLMEKLGSEHPGARMVFCPPFYWGPDGKHEYPEDRDAYLSALGQRLSPKVDVQWTGPRVKSPKVTKDHVKWITERLRRKPFYWQNTVIVSHAYNTHLVTDPLKDWDAWYYDGFMADMGLYTFNGDFPGHATLNALIGAYLWNPRAYVAEEAVREAAAKLCGPESWDALVEVNRCLSYFDPYFTWYYTRIDNAGKNKMAQNMAEVDEKLAQADEALKRAMTHYPAAIQTWTGLARAVALQKWTRDNVKREQAPGAREPAKK